MKIPYTIPKNVFAAYRCSDETLRLQQETNRTLRAEDEEWDNNNVPDLKILAQLVLIRTSIDDQLLLKMPTCIDRDLLLETLPTNLPLQLVVPTIPDEYYWKRVAESRWQFNDLSEHGHSWRRLYFERHLCEFLERSNPTYFESETEEREKLINLLKDSIYRIKIKSLLPKQQTKELIEEDAETAIPTETNIDEVHHIPMATILPSFENLYEIHFNFGVTYTQDDFNWSDFEFSLDDCMSLGDGIKACKNIRKFALTRSNLDQPRVAAILQKITQNYTLEELDFSHCKLGNDGALAVAEFLLIHPNLQVLHLANNNISSTGVAGVTHALLQKSTKVLKHLNLKLNPLQDAGIFQLCALLVHKGPVSILNVSSCEFTEEGGAALAEVLSSDQVQSEAQCLTLNICNNDIGPKGGEAFVATTLANPYITSFDCRMCNFLPDTEYAIKQHVLRNKKAIKGANAKELEKQMRI